jgi:hypothetical protein
MSCWVVFYECLQVEVTKAKQKTLAQAGKALWSKSANNYTSIAQLFRHPHIHHISFLAYFSWPNQFK